MRTSQLLALGIVVSLVSACGSNECKLDDPSSCSSDKVCEVVRDQEKPMCFAPVTLSGKVTDLDTGEPVSMAEVTALDVNGSPAGDVAVSDAGGNYTLRIPTERADDQGTPVYRKVSLRAAAADYATFPSGIRISLPVDTAAAQKQDSGAYVLSNEQTRIGLIPNDVTGGSSVSGTVEVEPGQLGALVVVEASGNAFSAIADASGRFTVFNVPSGGAKVMAYVRGKNFTPVDINVQAGADVTGVKLHPSEEPTAAVQGKVSLVAGATGETSVVLVPESTFNENLARGEMPPGLRAPGPGIAPNLTGDFTIEGVPSGKYVVLAAFENDGMVRDPDPAIGGTRIRHITVEGGTVTTDQGTPDEGTPLDFKVTAALVIQSPGGGDTLDVTSATPTFTWLKHSNADGYTVQVFDSFGIQAGESAQVLDISSATISYTVPSPLAPGIYQFRVTALRKGATIPTSLTEDLRGVFRVE
ncbi:MAG: hypothetical protein L0Y66_11785 [Myxococcaceae bacterium]|nr:hypothetical protein [Myxococcaceae bacterium]